VNYGYIDPRACIGMPPEHREHRFAMKHPLRSSDIDDPVMLRRLAAANGWRTPIIAKSAIVEAFASIDCGLERFTWIGERVYVMKHAHVGHDAYIGAGVNLAPGCVIGGHVTIGVGTKVGIGAVIRPRVTVGCDVVIGAGAVVVDNVPDGETWVGNPARPLRNHKGPTMAPDHWAGSEEEYQLWLDAFGPGYKP